MKNDQDTMFGFELSELVLMRDGIIFLPDPNQLLKRYKELTVKEFLESRDLFSLVVINAALAYFCCMEKFKGFSNQFSFEMDFPAPFADFIGRELRERLKGTSLQEMYCCVSGPYEKRVFWNCFYIFNFMDRVKPDSFKSLLFSLDSWDLELFLFKANSEIIKRYKIAISDVVLSKWEFFPFAYHLTRPKSSDSYGNLFSSLSSDKRFAKMAKEFVVNSQVEDYGGIYNDFLCDKKFLKCVNFDSATLQALEAKNNEYWQTVQICNETVNINTIADQNAETPISVRTEGDTTYVTINPKLTKDILQIDIVRVFGRIFFDGFLNVEAFSQNLGWSDFERRLTVSNSKEFIQSFEIKKKYKTLVNIISAVEKCMKDTCGENLLKQIDSYVAKSILSFISEDDISLVLGQDEELKSFRTRCVLLFSGINSLLKVYNRFIENRCQRVTSEDLKQVFDYSSGDPRYDNVKSCCKLRHVYFNSGSEEAGKILDLLFSQIICAGHKNVRCCFDWLDQFSIHEEIPGDLFPSISQLAETGIVKIEDRSVIWDFSSLVLVSVANLIHDFGEINFHPCSYSSDFLMKLEEVCKLNDWFHADDLLFSSSESKFLQYLLTDQVFSNCLGLRNKYCHGGSMIVDEDEAAFDYYQGLIALIFMILVIDLDMRIFRDFPNMRKAEMATDWLVSRKRRVDACEYSHVKAPAISPRAPVPVTTSAPPKF